MSDDCDDQVQYAKQVLSDALHQCVQYFKNTNLMNDQRGEPFLPESEYLAYKFVKGINKIVHDSIREEEEELFLFEEDIGELDTPLENVENPTVNHEADEHEIFESPVSDSPALDESSPSTWECTPEFQEGFISLEYKIKVVNMKREHKNWGISSIHRHGGARLPRIDELARWKKDIANGGTTQDKFEIIDSWTFDRFKEQRESGKPVFSWDLRVWALQAARQFSSENFKFKASRSWTIDFKRRHRIRMRKITRYVKPTEHNNHETMMRSNQDFRLEASRAIENRDKELALNTDQIGHEYRANISRTLAPKGSKAINAYIGDLNKVSHSYTAQWAITAGGTVLSKVFICLQESTDVFGPRVQQKIYDLVEQYGNVAVVCSKSGKMSKALVCLFIDQILKPYVYGNLVLIQDSWGGQGNDVVRRKLDEIGHEYEVLTVPAGCTGMSQPLDVYFFRQVKIFVKKLQNATELVAADRQLHAREDVIKIQSLVHNQLSAPEFRKMVQYAWFSSGLTSERTVFFNVNQVCFPEECLRKRCRIEDCNEMGFIKCSWCKKFLCFSCFYDSYHPQTCTRTEE